MDRLDIYCICWCAVQFLSWPVVWGQRISFSSLVDCLTSVSAIAQCCVIDHLTCTEIGDILSSIFMNVTETCCIVQMLDALSGHTYTGTTSAHSCNVLN